MFFFGPKVLLLLKRHSLEIYYKNSDKVMSIEFHESALRHLEVANKDEVIKTLVDAFKGAHLQKQKAVLVLSDHIVFERLIPDKPEVTQKEIARFYHDVPLEELHIAKKIIPLKGSVLALAANRELYQIIIEVAHEFEWKIKAVVPMTLFSKLDEKAQLSQEQVGHILGAGHVFKEADFLNESVLALEKPIEGEDKEGDEDGNLEAKGGKAKTAVTVLIALFLLSLIIGSLFYFKIISLPFNLPWVNTALSPAASVAPEASSSGQVVTIESTSSGELSKESTISAQMKKDVKIHVLNGSDIAGQAGKIKEKLVAAGFENVITGNIESSEASSSSIIYSTGLDGSIKEEINKLMDSLIAGITKTDEAINEFNAVITLGKLDKPIE